MANALKESPGSKGSGDPDFITLEKAIEIVLDLARRNIIEDPDMKDQAARQEAAIDTVEDFIVNNVFDGTEEKPHEQPVGQMEMPELRRIPDRRNPD